MTLREFVNDYVIGKDKWRKFLVTNEEGQLIGEIVTEDLKQIPTSKWTEIKVRELIKESVGITTVKSNQSLMEVIQLIEKQNLSELAVIKEDGVVVGLLEKTSIINLLKQEAEEAKAV